MNCGREGQWLAGLRRERSEKKQLAVRGKNTDTRDAEKVWSLEKDSQDARPLERGPRERRDDAKDPVRDGRTSPRSRVCCGTPASTASPQEMHGKTCEPRIIKA